MELDDRNRVVLLCVFRTCAWTSPDTRTMPVAEQDRVATEHLRDVHRHQIALMTKAVEQ